MISFSFEAGQGKCIIDGNEYVVGDGVAVGAAGAQHNVINTSDSEDLKLYTIYSRIHKDSIVRRPQEEATANGKPSLMEDNRKK